MTGYVDLLQVFRSQLITGNQNSLKITVPLSSFNWEVDEPGGDSFMVKHDRAVRGDPVSQEWLLTYNRGDVEATRAVRIWMDREASKYPPIESLEVWGS